MRIRLRVPKDGEPKPAGLFGWLGSLFSPAPEAAPVAAPAAVIDKRWKEHAKARYFGAGRMCRREQGNWESAYVFEVRANEEVQQMRIIVAESAVAVWEKKHGRRMPEALRTRLVQETLHAILDLERYPSAIHVNPLEIENANL